MTVRDLATERQVQAADPRGSTWLSANAGSGKTRVLTDRVARLLLDQVSPQHILCLTYTKAAATEMQNRLFRRLGAWAMMPDTNLRQELLQLGVEDDLTDETLRQARTHFARAIETPGGLKIQTIHSFCASLLRQFPLEAGVSPQFVEMEDRAAKTLRDKVCETLSEGPQSHVVATLAHYWSGDDLSSLTAELVKNTAHFGQAHPAKALRKVLKLEEDISQESLEAATFLGGEQDLITRLLPHLMQGSTNDVKAVQRLAAVAGRDPVFDDLPLLETVFLTGASAKVPFSAKTGAFPTKATRETCEPLIDELNNLMQRVEAAREPRLALESFEKTHALHQFANAFLPAYAHQKAISGRLDFDDLIQKARALLTDPAVAQWVLFRLDGGIDHILVDEAQDTSPAQWDVIERLAQEFTAGEGARADVERTIFVVGDKKQSIYSFQGADPEAFERMRNTFSNRLSVVDKPLSNMTLEHSFRSSNAILGLVDQIFDVDTREAVGRDVSHIAFKQDMPGRVDLWPWIEKAREEEDTEWYTPLDLKSDTHHDVVLANQIADHIQSLIRMSEMIPEEIGQSGTYGQRSIHAGDFLILVQRRSTLFHEIIRACKERHLEIAGADRLKVGAELAVKDLVALLSFLATPEDDLSLAAVLKSPLFGWSEQRLFSLAHLRGDQYLWEALRKADAPDTLGVLEELRRAADFRRPFDLIELILTRFNGRQNLLARLGAEAEDGIDALLSQALAYEQSETPSLTGFLEWVAADELEIKRQVESSGKRIRVMTIHGAKGLEAPIVILPDMAKRRVDLRDELLIHQGQAFWKTRSAETPAALKAARDAAMQAQENERLRLLYVAMTRAEKWLIVCGAGDQGKDLDSWYRRVAAGMEQAGAVRCDFAQGQGLRLSHLDWSGLDQLRTGDQTKADIQIPAFLTSPPPVPDTADVTLAPSDLGGAKALAGATELDEEAALQRGRDIHLLLETLPNYPDAQHLELAQRLVPKDHIAIDQAMALLQNPALRFLFAPDALAEVDISATLPTLDGRRIHGAIDRLIVEEDRILAVDFKSNATVPDLPEQVPDGLLRQMGAYAAGLEQIYPDRHVQTALLWTKTGDLMYLPQDLVIGSLQNATYA
jgi:ATP-dependent helicase/nuclease subunit A